MLGFHFGTCTNGIKTLWKLNPKSQGILYISLTQNLVCVSCQLHRERGFPDKGVHSGWFAEQSANQLKISPETLSWFDERGPKMKNLELVRQMFVDDHTCKILGVLAKPTSTPEI